MSTQLNPLSTQASIRTSGLIGTEPGQHHPSKQLPTPCSDMGYDPVLPASSIASRVPALRLNKLCTVGARVLC